jgi:butyrate kinase
MSGEPAFNPRLLVVNPGGVSTKLAYFEGERCIHSTTIDHDTRDLDMFTRAVDQLKYRLMAIGQVMHEWGVGMDVIDAVVARGAPLRPLCAGTYAVDAAMIRDIREGHVIADHPSMLGCMIARKLTAAWDKPAFVVDPVCVDELADEARVSGLKGIERQSLWHALNSRYVARLACANHGLDYEKSRLVVAHLGSGISVSAHVEGRTVDVNNANDMGPFAPTRAGGLPVTQLAKLCFAADADQASLMRRLTKNGGLCDLLGTYDMREVERRMDAGDEQAGLVWRAMAYQIAKEIGAMAVVCGGPQLIILTGGLAHSTRFVSRVSEAVAFLGPLAVMPGEMEMEALAAGALRVLRGEEQALCYEGVRDGGCRKAGI